MPGVDLGERPGQPQYVPKIAKRAYNFGDNLLHLEGTEYTMYWLTADWLD